MTEQIENKAYLRHLINAILENKRILVYRNEITGEIDDSFVLLNNYNNEGFDILTIPSIINKLNHEKQFISYLFETEKTDINRLSNLIVEYMDYKDKSYTIKCHVYAELIRLMNMLNYEFSIDYKLFNKYMFTGEVKYIVTLNFEKTATIIEKIEYCNSYRHYNEMQIGIHKCLAYSLE